MKKQLVFLAGLAMSATLSAGNVMIKSDGPASAVQPNIVELLRGKVSGLRVSSIDGNPVGELNVNIRGINSLRTDNQPLWIIDGVMVSTDLNGNLDAFWQFGESSYCAPLNPLAFLNVSEIESIEVLKDISATALFGANGANGVIIIKTRVPKSGETNIHFSTEFGLDTDARGLIPENRPSFNQNSYLAVGGVKNNTSYNISATLRNINGILPGNSSDYGSLKANFTTQANKTVWFGFNSLASLGRVSSPSAVSYLGKPSMTLRLRDASLSPATTFEEWCSDFDDDSNDFRSVSSTWLRINFTNNLYLKISAGFDLQRNKRILWYGDHTEFGAKSEDNQYGGAAGTLQSMLFGYNAESELVFSRYFDVKHHLSAGITAGIRGNKNEFNTMNGYNFVSHSLRGLGMNQGAYQTRIHTFIHQYFHYGASVHAEYDFDGIFGVKGFARIDDTPKYGGRLTNFYPGAETYLDIHKALFPERDGISSLKLTAGIGRSGREKFVPYELFESYLPSGMFEPIEGTSTFFDGINTLSTSEWHTGGQISFLSGRIDLSVTYFDRHSDDEFQVFQMGHPSEDRPKVWEWGGIEDVLQRKTGLRNHGFEFDLSAIPIRNEDWSWTFSTNVTYMANYITDNDKNDFHGQKLGNGIFCTCNGTGLPVSNLYGYSVDAAGNIIDRTKDGRIDEADMLSLGSTVPIVYGGLQTSLRYRNWLLEIEMDGAAGHKIAKVDRLVTDGIKDAYGIPVLTNDFVEDGGYLRLSALSLSYSMPVKAKWIQDLSIRLACRNVATVTKYSGWSPDVNCFGVNPLASGLDYGSYPVGRMFVAGIQVSF